MFDHASMNRAYRLVWSDRHNAYVAVAESARGRGQRAVRTRTTRSVATLLLAMSGAVHAQTVAPTQLPTGGRVAAGQANIVQSAARVDINQSSNRAAIDWQTFNVGANAQVNFNQPGAQSVTLNRVLDAQPSQIFGRITSNGQVFLTNPNGVYFSPTARADVGGLLATTLSMDVASFMAGGNTFNRNGTTGAVVNQGVLNAASGGYIALLAPEVRNEGVVTAQAGTVVLAAGEAITLNFNVANGGNSLAGITATPSQIKALVENKHVVLAPGGTVILSAQAADRLQGGVINNSGSIEANGLTQRDGRIVLEAAQITNAGSISASGGAIALRASNSIIQTAGANISASGEQAGAIALKAEYDVSLLGTVQASATSGKGGTITIEGEYVRIASQALIDARGATGGGTVLVGGDWQGSGSLQQARLVMMEQGAVIDVSATRDGDGGKAVLWSDVNNLNGFTQFDGRINALAAGSGKGGRVETSGHVLGVTGTVRSGKGGQWLLDPYDVTISTSGNQNVDASFNATGNSANVSASAIESALANGTDVTVYTGSSGSQSGNITLAADIQPGAMANDATLTLKASNSIFTNNGTVIDATQGGNGSKLNVVLWANAAGNGQGRIDLGANSAIYTNGGNIVMGGGSDITTGYAIGTGTGKLGRGIWVRDGTTFDAGGGDITLRGQGQNGGKGIAIGDPGAGAGTGSTFITSGSGAISITGVGTTASSGSSPSGLYLHNDVRIQTDQGAITLTGTGGAVVENTSDNSGVVISTGARILSDSGTITLNGTQGTGASTIGKGLRFGSGTSYLGHDGGVTIARSSSDIILSADSFSGGGSAIINTSGTFTFQPAGTSFGNAFTWSGNMTGADFVATGTLTGLRINNLADLTALTLGKSGNLASMTLASSLTLGGALSLIAGDVQLNEQINVQNQILTVTNSGTLTTAAGKTISADNGFNQNGTGANSLGGDITTNGAPIHFAGDVTVRDQIALSSNGGRITFDGTLTGAAVNVPARLALDSGNSDISFNGVVSNFDRLSLNAWGTVSQTARVQVQNLVATGEGDFTFTRSDNQIGTLAANIGSGSLVVNNATPLTIGSVLGVNGINSYNTVQIETAMGQSLTVNQSVTSPSPTLIAGGDLVLNAHVNATMGDIVLAAGNVFINTAGANALGTTGRWLVYSQSPANNTFGGLASGNTGLFGKTYATYGSADVASDGYSGNRFLFASNESITVTTTNTSNLYGAAPLSLADNYSVSPSNTYGGAILAPTLIGAPVISSAGSLATAHAGSYAITADVSGMQTNATGYDFFANNLGSLTVTPRPVALSGGRAYDATTAIAANQITLGGLVNGDTVSLSGVAPLTSKYVGTRSLANAGTLALSSGDYTLTGATSSFNITPATITVSGVTAQNKLYDATTQATLSGSATVSALGADVVSLAGAAVASFSDASVGNNKPVTVSGYVLSGADAGNYSLQQPAGLSANITAPLAAVAAASTLVLPVVTDTQVLLSASSTNFAAWLTPTRGGTLDISVAMDEGNSIKLANGPVAPFAGAVPVIVAEAVPGRGDEHHFVLPKALQDTLAHAGMQRVTLSRMDRAPLPKWLQFDSWRNRLVATQVPPGELPMAVLITVGTQKIAVKLDSPASMRMQVAGAAAD